MLNNDLKIWKKKTLLKSANSQDRKRSMVQVK